MALRSTRAVAALVLAIAFTPNVLHAHAALRKSDPRAGSTVGSELSRLRLEFSEDVVPDLCHVEIMGAGSHRGLNISIDPHDARVLLAPVPALVPAEYHIMWHVVSADGHPSEGGFRFSVKGSVPRAAATGRTFTRADDTTAAMIGEHTSNPFPTLAAVSKGIGLTALLALGGALIFSMGHGGARVREYRGWELVLGVVATVGLAIHTVFWAQYVMAPADFTSASLTAIFAHGPGRIEIIRGILVALALVLVLVRLSPPIVLVPAALAIAVTAAMGHPGSQHPILSVPLVFVHLGAVAVWTGGLVSLLVVGDAEPTSFRSHASLVSTVALLAVIVVSVTGAAESLILLTSPADLLFTAYGRWILVKLAGLFILVIFGWHHRFRALPALTNDEPHGMTLSLRMETAVMTATIIAAAFLSYTATPR